MCSETKTSRIPLGNGKDGLIHWCKRCGRMIWARCVDSIKVDAMAAS
jgi:hypothetical protein